MGSEDINPVITLTRGGDVFVDIDIIVEVLTLQAPQSPSEFIHVNFNAY